MFASIRELLVFLDEEIYSQGFAGSHRLDPATVNVSEIQLLAQAQKLGYITVKRGTQEDRQNLFDVALTAQGLIEIIFTSRSAPSQNDQDATAAEIEVASSKNSDDDQFHHDWTDQSISFVNATEHSVAKVH